MVRRTAEQDGRKVHVTLTEAGRELVHEVLPGHLATEEELLAGLSPEQRRALADGLRALLESLGDGG